MAERYDDARLEAVLRSIGAHLSTSEAVDEEATVTPLPQRRPPLRSGRWIAAAAAALIAVGAVGALTPVGDTVAGWFGLGGLSVTVVLPEETLPAPDAVFTDDVRPLDAAAAWERAGIAPETFDDSALGRPDVYGEPPEGGVVFGWDGGGSSLWVRRASDDAENVVKKQVVDASSAEWVQGLGDTALLIDGDHILETPFRRVGADRVVWWIDGDTEYRFESTLPGEDIIDVAQLVAR
jgi:hypothetical protein